MRQLLISTAIGLAAFPALADDIALVLGTEAYEDIDNLSRGADVTVATTGISALGFDVTVLRDGGAAETEATLAGFLEQVPDADRILIVLSGRFATDGDRTWYLTGDTPVPGILALSDGAVSVESLLQILSRAQGRALLLLGRDSDPEATFDPWLAEGIGALDVPQGVTVVQGQPQVIADLMRQGLSQPEADLSALLTRSDRVIVQGFLPAGFTFMPPPPVVAQPAPQPDTVAADEALWRRVVAQDNVDAYRGYLRQFPDGRHVSEAEAAIAAILAEPFRDERLAEEALALSRDQRRDIQGDLTTMGFDTRGIDGIFGQGTRRAITNWQQENGFAQTGYVTMEQINRLDGQAARREAELSAEAERQRQEAERLDRAYWEETGARGDVPGLTAYLDRYPDGLYADIAQDELARLGAQQEQELAARDRAAWNAARSADTAEAYRRYLRDFPRGNFTAEAEARIASLEGAPEPMEPQPPGGGDGPSDEEVSRAAQVEEALNLNALTARLVESRLAALDMNPGEVDGNFNRQTRRAILRFQEANGIAASGYLDEQTLVLLLAGVVGGN